MKKVSLIAVFLAFSLTACATKEPASSASSSTSTASQEAKSAPEREDSADSSADDGASETATLAQPYVDLVEYYEALQSSNAANVEIDEDLFSLEASNCDQLAYALMDLDHDGQEELLLFDAIEDESDEYYAMIYGLFDIQDGELIPVFVKTVGTAGLTLRENDVLCYYVGGSGYRQINYVTYTGDPENAFSVIENTIIDDTTEITVDGETDYPFNLDMARLHGGAGSPLGDTPYSRLSEEMTSGTREEWTQALEEIGYTLIDEDEMNLIDEKYPRIQPADYTRFPPRNNQ